MHSIVKDILKQKVKIPTKERELQSLKEDIEIAEKILSGEFTYCENCDDYFLSKSFFTEEEVKEEEICTYTDPINSSGNEYKNSQVQYTYKICPKGHKHIMYRKEV